jgi:hypothetical protein
MPNRIKARLVLPSMRPVHAAQARLDLGSGGF